MTFQLDLSFGSLLFAFIYFGMSLTFACVGIVSYWILGDIIRTKLRRRKMGLIS